MDRQTMFKKILFWIFETKDQGQEAERVCAVLKRVPDLDLLDLIDEFENLVRP